jgi:predicted TPR repeat methyltransferase
VFQVPADADAHARLADELLKAGDLEAACYQLEQFLRFRPGDRDRTRRLTTLQRLLELREE